MTVGQGIVLQRCADCDRWYIPAVARCPVDPAHLLDETAVAGTGVVFSYTVTHVAMSPTAKDHVPYVTTLVQLSEGPRLLTHFAGEADRVRIGMPVAVDAVADPTSHMPPGAILATPLDSRPGDGTPK